MINLRKLVLVVLIINSISVKAQFNCKEYSCDFGNLVGKSVLITSTGNAEPNGNDILTNGWIINNSYVLVPTWTNAESEFQKYFTSRANGLTSPVWSYGSTSHYICLPPTANLTRIESIIHTTTNDGWPNVNDYQAPRKRGKALDVIDITGTTRVRINGIEGNPVASHYTSNNWTGELLPGHIYEVSFYFTYEDKRGWNSDEDDYTRIFICIGGFGSPGNNGRPDKPVVKTNCQTGDLSIDFAESPKLQGFEFYWSTTNATPLEDPNASKGVTYNPSQTSGTINIWVQGKATIGGVDYITKVEQKTIQFPIVPAAPVYTGPKTLCACSNDNPQLSFTTENQNNSFEWFSSDRLGDLANLKKYSGSSSVPYDFAQTQDNLQVQVVNKETGCFSGFSSIPEIDLIDCDCDQKFSPTPGDKYVVSAWVKEGNDINLKTYSGPTVIINFIGSGANKLKLQSSGKIIDGWQRISEIITIPKNTKQLEIELFNSGSQDIWIDDIRFQPFNSSMITYVYDPHTYKLVAELDDNNFKTEYIYNHEGNLVKTNVETEDGVRTISENRSHVKKR